MESDAFEVEVAVMTETRKALAQLDEGARHRVIRWLGDAFGVQSSVTTPSLPEKPGNNVGTSAAGHRRPSSFADLIEITEPANNADRALVAGFWLQESEGQESFDGRSVNKLLKEHGVDVSNVTNALNSLIARKPRFAMQAGKKGKFEKLYRLTTEGRKAVLVLLDKEES